MRDEYGKYGMSIFYGIFDGYGKKRSGPCFSKHATRPF